MKTRLALLLAALVSCVRTPQLRDDNNAAGFLRLLSVPIGEHTYELRWEMPGVIPEPQAYVVLRAPFPITDANRGHAESTVVSAVGTDPTRPGPEALVRLEPDSGVHYFAVLAILAGRSVTDSSFTGPLSDSLSVDTTQRAAWIETRADGAADLVIGDLAGNAVVVERSDDATIETRWAPTGNLLGFVHDGMLGFASPSGDPLDGANELARARRTPTSIVETFRFGASGTSLGILGRAFLDPAAGSHLFAMDVISRAAIPVSDFAAIDARVADFTGVHDGLGYAFLSDQRGTGTDQLFASFGARGTLLNLPLGSSETIVAAAWAPRRPRFAYLVRSADEDAVALFDYRFDAAGHRLLAVGRRTDNELLRFSPDGALLAAVLQTADDVNPGLHLFDVAIDRRPLRDLGDDERVDDVIWSPDATRLLVRVAGDDGSARLLLLAGQVDEIRSELIGTAGDESLGSPAFSPLATRIAVAVASPEADRVELFDSTGQPETSVTVDDRIAEIAWAADDRQLWLVAGGEVRVLDAVTGRIRALTDATARGAEVTSVQVARIGWRPVPQIDAEPRFGPAERGVDEGR